MIQLHYHPGNASMAPHILLEELGRPFELCLVDRANQAHKSAAYLRLNPNGLIPAMTDGELVLFETAAMLLHLADTHPGADLMPPLGSADRAHAYKWLMWLTNTLQPALIAYFYPDRWVAAGNTGGAQEVKTRAEARVGELLDILETEFVRHGAPWTLGDRYSALDPMTFMLCRWTRGFHRPARQRPVLAAFLSRMAERPALRRVMVTEGLADAPWY